MSTFRLTGLLVSLCLLPLAAGAQTGHEAGSHHEATVATGQPATLAVDLFTSGQVTHLLVAEDAGAGPVLLHRRSMDGGRTWSASVVIEASRGRLSGASRGTDPQVVAIGDRVVALWMAKGTSSRGNGLMERAVSTDGGRTWSAAARVDDEAAAVSQAFIDATADTRGVMHAVWLDSRDGGQGLRTSTSRDGGQSWSKAVTSDARTCECCWNTVTDLGSGTLGILYRDKDPRDMALARSTDGGASWTRASTVGAFDWGFDGCPHVGGALVIGAAPGRIHAYVWTGHDTRRGAYVLTSADAGQTWATPVAVGPTDAWHVDLARVDDTLVAAWDVNRPGDAHIAWASSSDGGRTWTDGGRVSSSTARPSHPRIVAGAGAATLLWTERSQDGVTRLAQRTVTLSAGTR